MPDEKEDKRYPAAAAEKPVKKSLAKVIKTVKTKTDKVGPDNGGKEKKRYPAAATEKPVKKDPKKKSKAAK